MRAMRPAWPEQKEQGENGREVMGADWFVIIHPVH